MKFTQDRIDALECPPGKQQMLVFDDEQRGLAVRVTAGGSKTYYASFRHGGEKQRIKLGACDAISLAKARAAVRGILGDVAYGRNPGAERREAARAARRKAADDALTLTALVNQWASLHLKAKRPRYRDEAVRAIRSVFAKQLNLPAANIDRKTVVQVLDKLAEAGSPMMAARAAAYARACYRWAVKRGALGGNPFMDLPVAPTLKRNRKLSDDELRAVWQAAEGLGPFNRIVRMLILTGQRREEVASMAWNEISPDLSTWTLPASRAKNNVEHIVPLSAQAQAIVAGQPRPERKALDESPDLVFPGLRGTPFNGFSKAKDALDRAAGVTGYRLHDLRRTVATGLQKLGVRLEVTEACLNHVSGSRAGIVGVYQQHNWVNEKRAALDAWGARVEAIVAGQDAEQATNVVALRGT